MRPRTIGISLSELPTACVVTPVVFSKAIVVFFGNRQPSPVPVLMHPALFETLALSMFAAAVFAAVSAAVSAVVSAVKLS